MVFRYDEELPVVFGILLAYSAVAFTLVATFNLTGPATTSIPTSFAYAGQPLKA